MDSLLASALLCCNLTCPDWRADLTARCATHRCCRARALPRLSLGSAWTYHWGNRVLL